MDDDPIVWHLVLQLVLIMVNAVFSCAEIAVISINDNKVEKLAEKGDPRAQKLSLLIRRPSDFLATIQVGITLAGFLGSAFAAGNFSDKLVHLWLSWGIKVPEATLRTAAVVLITLILSYITLIFGELVPKRIAMKKAEALALSMSSLIYMISRLFAPIVWFLTKSTNGLLRLIGIDPNATDEDITEEEIRMMIDVGTENGTIDLDEKEMIHNIFEFDNKTASEIMTHRTDVVVLWLEETDEEWEKTIFESRHSIYPVCNETMDNIVGNLNTKDYFRLKDRSRDNVLAHAIKPSYYIPETVRADILFKNMQLHKNHFAIVLDEYGGMDGIITINDLLEELVGDLGDEANEELPTIQKIDDACWEVDGPMELEDLSKHIGVSLPYEDYETLGGMVFDLIGSVPEDGTTLTVEGFGLSIDIQEIKDHRLERACVRILPPPDTNPSLNK